VESQIRCYRDLKVWQKGIDLVAEVYRQTASFHQAEQFGLTSQARRAAVSIPANIAEGHSRQHRREFRNFLSMAMGSLAELETHFEIAVRLGYLTQIRCDELLMKTVEINKMLHGLLKALPAPDP